MTLPSDLVALRGVCGSLGLTTRRLVEMSEAGTFPVVYQLDGKLRVSESAVSSWLESRSVQSLAERHKGSDAAVRRREGAA